MVGGRGKEVVRGPVPGLGVEQGGIDSKGATLNGAPLVFPAGRAAAALNVTRMGKFVNASVNDSYSITSSIAIPPFSILSVELPGAKAYPAAGGFV